jgi:hypothetical protein
MPVKFIVVENRDKNLFADSVNTLLSQGWSLHGSTIATTVVLGHNGVTTYIQALTSSYHNIAQKSVLPVD